MIEKPKGTNDYLYPESQIRKQVINQISSFLEKLGYEPIETPIFENVELFKRSAGISSDIVSKEMYEFLDKKGRQLALRPEITAPVVRAIIQNNLINQPIIKLYYFGSIFRYEKPQKDRYRQATQFGIEFFGMDKSIADFETILIAHNIYKTIFNLEIEIHLNSIGCKDCRPEYRNKIYNYFTNFKDMLCSDCQRRLEENPLRILDCKNETCKEISQKSPKSSEYLCQNCKEHFTKLLEILKNQNIPIVQNPLLVRGLDYYNRTVFEVKHNNTDLAGGGRYDYLVNQISQGKYDIPAVGFAGGLERLTNLLKEKKYTNKLLEEKLKINIVSLSEKADNIMSNIYSKIIDKIIKKNKNIEIHLTKFDNLSKALKTANKLKINYFIFIGEEELKNDEITIKNMETGKQEKISIENTISKILQIIENNLE
ncbi:MAG: histidine--tRNA ligase [Candidatus Calescibacterium sp.]|nr:histidine--tRNA ligase [Candidatus Calescibacterium sp.]MDW8132067.1 histidine--tRNA ligase [Candidatus Calescibacterium sp.]